MAVDPIIVTGAARSGLGLVAGVLNICGAWTLTGPGKRRSFDNKQISQQVIEPILMKVKADPEGQKPLPVTSMFHKFDGNFILSARETVFHILVEQGCGDGPWVFKEPKATLCWYVLDKMFSKARWIVVRRNAEDIVTSCIKTRFMKAYSSRAGWLGWVAAHERLFEEMLDAKLCVFQVWPQTFIDGDFTGIQSVVNNLGLSWDFDKVLSFVSPAVWHRTKRMEVE